MFLYLDMIYILFLIILVMVGMSFLTLLERKVLSYIQYRKGPNKAGITGILQSFSDAIKLFSKEIIILSFLDFSFYFFCPFFVLMMSFLSWMIIPVTSNIYSFSLSMLFLFCCLGFSSYSIIIAGWSSNSTYSMLGCVRSIAQIISYEVSFMLIMMSVLLMSESYSLLDVLYLQSMISMNIIYLFPIFVIFFVSILAELNRAPFDFIEGESELVSGFNTEYHGGGFSLIFMGEYCMIMFMSSLTSILFLGISIGDPLFLFSYMFFVMLIIFLRGVLPRFRFDELMYLCWFKILPISLSYLSFLIIIKWFMML